MIWLTIKKSGLHKFDLASSIINLSAQEQLWINGEYH